MGLAGAVRDAALGVVAESVEALDVSDASWATGIAIDGSLGVSLALVALSLECALFAAVVRLPGPAPVVLHPAVAPVCRG